MVKKKEVEKIVATNGSKRNVTDQDAIIGNQIKALRILLGLTQVSLSEILGITFQQVQKYEKGLNRISASMLWKLASTIGVNVSMFFPASEDVEGTAALKVAEKKQNFDFNFPGATAVENKEYGMLWRHYSSIKDVAVRKKIAALCASLAENENESQEQA
jgi:transcriptional regulator with XRE-family HTH domain